MPPFLFNKNSPMKPATIAPFYGCLYPGLCDRARELGYALTIHGSVVTDLDLVAIPWTEEAVDTETLVKALFEHLNAVDYRGLLTRDCDWASEKEIDQMVASSNETNKPESKPHGRKAWNLYLHFGAKVDLSVMPRLPDTCQHEWESRRMGGDPANECSYERVTVCKHCGEEKQEE